MALIEPLLLACARLCTYSGGRLLTNASGFFFEHAGQLFVITSRHVLFDEPSEHRPDRLDVEIHCQADNLAEARMVSLALYDGERPLWRQGVDGGGEVDVAALPLPREWLPQGALLHSFSEAHLAQRFDLIEVGTPLLVVGFPLGFHDTLHHLPVARQALIASSFGLRFQGQGYFLTDARTHRGISGAPVVMRRDGGELPWRLLGVHSARLDMTRDLEQDETLGLNCAWYADILLTLCSGAA